MKLLDDDSDITASRRHQPHRNARGAARAARSRRACQETAARAPRVSGRCIEPRAGARRSIASYFGAAAAGKLLLVGISPLRKPTPGLAAANSRLGAVKCTLHDARVHRELALERRVASQRRPKSQFFMHFVDFIARHCNSLNNEKSNTHKKIVASCIIGS